MASEIRHCMKYWIFTWKRDLMKQCWSSLLSCWMANPREMSSKPESLCNQCGWQLQNELMFTMSRSFNGRRRKSAQAGARQGKKVDEVTLDGLVRIAVAVDSGWIGWLRSSVQPGIVLQDCNRYLQNSISILFPHYWATPVNFPKFPNFHPP